MSISKKSKTQEELLLQLFDVKLKDSDLNLGEKGLKVLQDLERINSNTHFNMKKYSDLLKEIVIMSPSLEKDMLSALGIIQSEIARETKYPLGSMNGNLAQRILTTVSEAGEESKQLPLTPNDRPRNASRKSF